MITHRGGCHCGRVRFEVRAPARISVSECNCSICSKSGYLGLVVPAERFKLIGGSDALTTYTFNTGAAKHLFCAHCGINRSTSRVRTQKASTSTLAAWTRGP